MSEELRNFLCELKKLLDKYSIEKIDSDCSTIMFISNGDVLSIRSYDDGEFAEVITKTSKYKPKE